MSCPLPFPDDLLSDAERAALVDLARRLWEVRDVLAADWSAAVEAAWQRSVAAGAGLSAAVIARTAETFVAAGLERMRAGDFEGLSQACYASARALI
jgi:hypothetical protein